MLIQNFPNLKNLILSSLFNVKGKFNLPDVTKVTLKRKIVDVLIKLQYKIQNRCLKKIVAYIWTALSSLFNQV